jgi:hypothetical protein
MRKALHLPAVHISDFDRLVALGEDAKLLKRQEFLCRVATGNRSEPLCRGSSRRSAWRPMGLPAGAPVRRSLVRHGRRAASAGSRPHPARAAGGLRGCAWRGRCPATQRGWSPGDGGVMPARAPISSTGMIGVPSRQISARRARPGRVRLRCSPASAMRVKPRA